MSLSHNSQKSGSYFQPKVSQSHNESSEDENESEEHQQHDEYEEVQGEYDDDYEHGGEDYVYVQSPVNSKGHTRSSRSSIEASQRSSTSESRKNQNNQDLIASLPEDISSCLIKFWHDMEQTYSTINENAFDGINKAHKKLFEYSNHFQEQVLKQLDAPDRRENAAQLFKSDFNRVPAHLRSHDDVKSVLHKRISEFLIKLEGITEEKYAQSKRKAYAILSKENITEESEKLVRLFGVLLLVETDRFTETIKFINEHYYTVICIELGLQTKIKWKEIMDIGLIKKKFLCEHYREQCLLKEQLLFQDDGELSKENSNESISSDSDVCGGDPRGQDFALICEDEEDSTPTDEELTKLSLLNKYDDEGEEEMDFGENDAKMSGEMKISLEFDNEEFMGEAGWDAYTPRRGSPLSGETARTEKGVSLKGSSQMESLIKGRESQISSTKSKGSIKIDGSIGAKSAEDSKNASNNKNKKSTNKDSAGKKSKKESEEAKVKESQPAKISTDKNKSSEGSKKKKVGRKSLIGNQEEEDDDDEEEGRSSQFVEEEGDEELEMEPENVETETVAYFEDEYPGEFWEGEGYDSAYRHSKAKKKRESSVTFDEKETYIRDFFWDSDPSKQDVTDMSNASQGKEECNDEGYYDQEEYFDDEDVYYDRDEFFEPEVESPKKGERKSAPEPSTLHFSIFGKEREVNNLSLLNRLLLKWSRPGAPHAMKPEDTVTDVNSNFVEQGQIVNGKTERRNSKGHDKKKSSSSSTKGLSPPTPISTTTATKYHDAIRSMSIMNSQAFMGGGDAALRFSFLEQIPGGQQLLLQLNPKKSLELFNEGDDNVFPAATEMVQQKIPLLECFINLQDEVWTGFETTFKEARKNIEKVMGSLKGVVGRAYPIETPSEPGEVELDVNELIARGQAIEEKYRKLRASKARNYANLKGFYEGEYIDEIEGEDFSPEYDEEEDQGVRKSSFLELVPFQARKTLSSELGSFEHEQQEKMPSIVDSSEQQANKEKRASADENGSPVSNDEEKHDVEEGAEGSIEEEKEQPGKKSSTPDSANLVAEVKSESCSSSCSKSCSESFSETCSGSCSAESSSESLSETCVLQCFAGHTGTGVSLEQINSPQSDGSIPASTETKTNLERSLADTDIRLNEQDTPSSPSPSEEQRILKRSKQALLKLKLQNWEKALETEKERLVRQLALLELHAQQEFHMLRNLPKYIWEQSKIEAANVYMDDLKRDKEVAEIFKYATEDASLLYGKFLIDRKDLMLLLKGNEPPIPLKYNDEYVELSRGFYDKRRPSYFTELEE